MRLRQLREAYPIRLIHKSFLLRPEENSKAVFTEYHLQHRRAAREMTGLPYALPAVGSTYPRSSFPALEAAKWAEERHPEEFDRFDLALLEAFFKETRDISNPDTLAEVAKGAGLTDEGLREALETRKYREAVTTDHLEAVDSGVHSIPTVVIGGYALSGAVPYEEYERLLKMVSGGG